MILYICVYLRTSLVMPGTTEDIEDTERTEHCNRPLRSSAHSAVRNELISSRPQFALTRVPVPGAAACCRWGCAGGRQKSS